VKIIIISNFKYKLFFIIKNLLVVRFFIIKIVVGMWFEIIQKLTWESMRIDHKVDATCVIYKAR